MTEKKKKEIDKIIHEEYTYHFFFNHGLFDELLLLKDLIGETKEYLTEKVESHSKDPIEDPSDLRFGKHTLFSGLFPHVIWRSLLLYMYSLMEDSLNQICVNLEKEKNYSLSFQDINGNGIIRSSVYLTKVANIPSSFSNHNWTQIKNLKLIRNCLLHLDGKFSRNDKSIQKACKALKLNYQGLEKDDFNILIDYEFCSAVLIIITEFFHSIHNSMQKLRWPDHNLS